MPFTVHHINSQWDRQGKFISDTANVAIDIPWLQMKIGRDKLLFFFGQGYFVASTFEMKSVHLFRNVRLI